MKRAEFIKKWLEALESGEYEQGKQALRTETKKGFKYCCLGVACEIAEKNGKRVDWLERFGEYLPDSMTRLLGITWSGRFVTHVYHNGRMFSSLAILNDGGVRFTTIARIIREQMKKGNFSKPRRRR